MAADGRPADMFGQARTPQKGGPGPIIHRCAREGCGKPFASCGIGEAWFCVGCSPADFWARNRGGGANG